MKTKHGWLPAALSLVLTFIVIAPCRAGEPYHFLKEITIGGDGGWDYLSIDAAARRLYVSHGTVVVVIDLDKDAVVGQIEDTQGVHGIAIAPELGLCFTSDGKENKVSIVDLKTLKTNSKVDTGDNPDAILYEPGRQEVYAFNGRGESATVIDAKTGKVAATIALPGKPEFCAADPAAGRVYCNLEDKSQLVAIDTKTHQVADTWPVAPGEEPSGLAIDTANHRLFIGCENKTMVMMDSATGKVITSVPIGNGVDATKFDDATMLAFSSCGEGTVTIAHEDAPDKLTVVQTLTTEPRARTMAVDAKTHKIYLSSAKFEAQPAQTPATSGTTAAVPGAPAGQRPRPKIIPGTFKILVYGVDKS